MGYLLAYKVDELTAGWQPTDLIIVAARPAMGKTAFTLSMARNIAVDSKVAVAFFSLGDVFHSAHHQAYLF